MDNDTIIHVTQSLGGVETYLMMFLEQGAFDNFRNRVLVVPERTALADAWEERGGSVVVMEMKRALNLFSDLRVIAQLRRLFKRCALATVHLHSSKGGALGRIAATFLPSRYRPKFVIYTPHAFYYLAFSGIKRYIFLIIERVLAYSTDALLATSPSEASRAVADVGYGERKVFCVSNAVKISANPRARSTRDMFEVIFVGRLCYQKNIDLLLKVISLFSVQDRIRFTLIGAGHYADDRRLLEDAIRKNGVDRSLISLVDWMPRDELMERYAYADLCLLTSRYESFGYVVAEANAVGTPVVSTNVDGVRDIIEHGATGLLIDGENPRDFYSAILKLKHAPDLLRKMGIKARRRIETRFSIEKNAQELARFYEARSDVVA